MAKYKSMTHTQLAFVPLVAGESRLRGKPLMTNHQSPITNHLALVSD